MKFKITESPQKATVSLYEALSSEGIYERLGAPKRYYKYLIVRPDQTNLVLHADGRLTDFPKGDQSGANEMFRVMSNSHIEVTV